MAICHASSRLELDDFIRDGHDIRAICTIRPEELDANDRIDAHDNDHDDAGVEDSRYRSYDRDNNLVEGRYAVEEAEDADSAYRSKNHHALKRVDVDTKDERNRHENDGEIEEVPAASEKVALPLRKVKAARHVE